MNYFKTAKFSLQMFMQQDVFKNEYLQELQKNPMIELSMKCMQFNERVVECEMRNGPNHQECQAARLEAAACAASVFAPVQFERWISCLNEHQDSENPLEECDQQGMTAIEESANQYERLMARGSSSVTSKQLERCQKECNFPQDDFDAPMMECIVPIVCPDEVVNFLQCTEKNKNDYGAPSCQSYGKALAKKLAIAMGDLSVLVERDSQK